MAMDENKNKKIIPKPFEKAIRRQAVSILGIPIDNQPKGQIVNSLFLKIEEYQKKGVPLYISTINTDFLVHTHRWNSPLPRLPELIRILRHSAIATADGMPIVWLSRLLGDPLKMRNTGVDLFKEMCQECHVQEKAIFFLGGEEKTTRMAAKKIQEAYPRVHIVGILCPKIAIEGEEINNSIKQDLALIDQIHNAAPEILVLCLGNPKQEIWFARVQHLLNIPLTIGLGGTLKFFAQEVKRAPMWMQKNGLEWFYRLLQEPGHLWKRYLVDIIKFTYLATPLLGTHYALRFLSLFNTSSLKTCVSKFRIQSKQYTIIMLPPVIDDKTIKEVRNKILEAFEFSSILFDFQRVKFVALKGVSLLVECLLTADEYQKKWSVFNISFSIRCLFKAHKIWDLLSPLVADRPKEFLQTLSEHERVPCFSINASEKTLHIAILGALKDSMDYHYFRREVSSMLEDKDCLIDLQYCTEIENAGIGFLLHMKKIQSSNKRDLKISSPSSEVRQQLKIAKVYFLFSD